MQNTNYKRERESPDIYHKNINNFFSILMHWVVENMFLMHRGDVAYFFFFGMGKSSP